MLNPERLPRIQAALAAASLDGWLLQHVRGINLIAIELLGVHGTVTRRVFGRVPRAGAPVTVTHAIEQAPWSRWPAAWQRRVYSS